MQTSRLTFFARHALTILIVVFFLIPFAMRGARLALEQMKNDVTDWLPSDFAETSELNWFRELFMGEQFVLVSWKDCTADDQRLKMFADLLVAEGESPELEADRLIGDKLGLFVPTEFNEDGQLRPVYYDNWGGENEKWFHGSGDTRYYIKEDGKLYKWSGAITVPGALGRWVEKSTSGKNELIGKEVALVDPSFYKFPRRLQARFFKSVKTGPDVLAELTAPDSSLMYNLDPLNEEDRAYATAKAHDRLRGVLFGPDDKQTCLVVTLSEAGKKNLRRTLGRGVLGKPMGKLHELADQAGITQDEIRLGGPPVDNVAIDEEGERTLANLVVFSLAVGFGLSYFCLRSVKLTMMVFFVGGVSAVISMSLVWWLGYTADAVLMTMPAVVYVLGLSGAIHVVNYYRDAVEEHGAEGAPERALAHSWWPCTIAALTTALGLGSLCTSNIIPIWKFGFFSALGVLATLILLFSYLPSALEMWAPKPKKNKASTKIEPSPMRLWLNAQGEKFANIILEYNVRVATICFVGFLFFAYGLTYIKTSVQMLNMFDSNSRIIKDYEWLEGNMGKLVPMELVVRVHPDAIRPSVEQLQNDAKLKLSEGNNAGPEYAISPKFQYNMLDRMEMAKRVQDAVEAELGPDGTDVAGRAMSVLTFAPELPEAGGRTDVFATRSKTNKELEEHRNDFLGTDFLKVDPADDAELWRISLRLGALQNVDYGTFVTNLKELAEPVVAAYRYRDEILRKIDQDREGGGYAASRIVLLGVNPSDHDKPEYQATEKEMTREEKVTEKSTEIFASTLRDLLKNARLKVNEYNPEENSEARLNYILNGAKKYSKINYVVLIKDSPNFAASDIAELDEHIFDCREHAYDPDAPLIHLQDEDRAAVSVVYTGVVPVVYKAANTLLESLIESTFLAFFLIAIVMAFVLRNILAGMVSMLPNIFPVVAVFGYMGWRGIEVDIGTMMTASVAMGVAVDDTVHFLTWFRWGLNEGLDRKGAIKEAYRRCSLAMMQTTLIGGLGLAIFAFSSFTPTQRFGYLMISLLAAALVGDLIFLPALLAGPLGKVFKASKKEDKSLESDGDTHAEYEDDGDDGDDDQGGPDIIPVNIGNRETNPRRKGRKPAKESKYHGT
ncbi:MAG: hypothetical protein COA78_14375 [Blastopirellula sp.]|nr:MAG: hypothetical protein COA78_14375 [Blastopirellula sp.]